MPNANERVFKALVKEAMNRMKLQQAAKSVGVVPGEGSWRWATKQMTPRLDAAGQVLRPGKTVEQMGGVSNNLLRQTLYGPGARLARKRGIERMGLSHPGLGERAITGGLGHVQVPQDYLNTASQTRTPFRSVHTHPGVSVAKPVPAGMPEAQEEVSRLRERAQSLLNARGEYLRPDVKNHRLSGGGKLTQVERRSSKNTMLGSLVEAENKVKQLQQTPVTQRPDFPEYQFFHQKPWRPSGMRPDGGLQSLSDIGLFREVGKQRVSPLIEGFEQAARKQFPFKMEDLSVGDKRQAYIQSELNKRLGADPWGTSHSVVAPSRGVENVMRERPWGVRNFLTTRPRTIGTQG